MSDRWMISIVMMMAVSCASHAADVTASDAAQRVGRLLDKVLPTLEKTVGLVDQHDSLPEKSLNPFDVDQRSNQSAMNDLLDKAINVLEVSNVTAVRNQIRALQEQNRESNNSIAEYRRRRIGATNVDDLTRLQKINPLVTSREEFDKMIEEETSSMERRAKELKRLKIELRNELEEIGLEIDDEGIDALLGSISGDDFLSMLTVFQNIKQITAQLQTLTDESSESLDVAKRYYGMYVVLVQTMDRLQQTFVDEINSDHIPKLQEFVSQAQDNIDEAKKLIRSGGGTAEVLRANIESNQTTQQAAKIYIQYLQENARLVSEENRQTQISRATAQNTYKTVRLSGEVAELLQSGRRNFDALMKLQLPTIREFGNEKIEKEFQRMTLELRSNK